MSSSTKNRLKAAVKSVVYGNVEPSFYKDNADVLNESNYKIVDYGTIVLAVVDILYALFEYLRGLPTKISQEYFFIFGIWGIIFLIFFVISKSVLSKHKNFTHGAYLLFYALAFAQCLISSTWLAPHDRMIQVYFCIMTVPVLYIEKPIHTHLIVIISCVISFFTALYVKHGQSQLMLDEFAAVMCCLCITLPFVYIMRNITLGNIQARQYFRVKSEHDELTGLFNKEACELAVKNYLDRFEDPCVLFMIDVDNFKSINDNYGHQQGDEVLKMFGEVLGSNFRSEDFVGRVGGDEFMAMMKGTDSAEVIQRKLTNISTQIHKIYSGDPSRIVSCSIGAAARDPEFRDTFETLFKAADEALYVSKNNGKDRGTLFEPSMAGTRDESKRGE